MGFMRNFLSGAAVAILGLGMAGAAKADALLEEAVTFNGAILHFQTGVPGLVIGAVRGGEMAVAGFGETQRGSGNVPNGSTVLRLGSITKVFTGEMLARAVARGEVRFTDPVAPRLPGRLGAAAARHPEIRLIDLVTHAGGLPREVPRATAPEDDPFATITHDAFAAWLETEPLRFRPGQAIAYSNFGFDLLSTALAEAGGAPYPALLEQRIIGPRGLDDTSFVLRPDMEARLMTGHAPDGTPLPVVPSGPVINGSGGLYSTPNDLLRWMAWHLQDGGPDAEVRFLDHASYVQRDGLEAVLSMDESGRMDAMGLGWVVMMPEAGRPFMLQKAGALQGQMSYIAFAPRHGTAVFVSMNQFDFAAAPFMTEAANALLATLSGF